MNPRTMSNRLGSTAFANPCPRRLHGNALPIGNVAHEECPHPTHRAIHLIGHCLWVSPRVCVYLNRPNEARV